MREPARKPNRGRIAWGGLALLATFQAPVRSQAPPPSTPAPASPTSRGAVTVEELAERLRAMEALNRNLVEQLERSRRESEGALRQQQDEMRRLMGRVEELSTRLSGTPAAPPLPAPNPAAPVALPGVVEPIAPAPGAVEPIAAPPPALPAALSPAPGAEGPPGASRAPEYTGPVPEYETQPIEPNPFLTPAPGLSTIATPSRVPVDVNFGPGFQFLSRDDEFLLQVHIQSQVEARIWGDPNGGAPFLDGFYLPRQRIFFNGRITKPIEYVFSINRGFGDLNILETFLNFHPDDRFQVRFGRYFTPLGYDQFAVRNLWLPTPERSLFTTNLGPNRQVGLMAWGYLLDKRLDYAAGVFTGPRNSFEDRNNAKDFTGYLNARPFQESDRFEALRNWNIGASVAYGRQNQPAVPLAFRVGAVAPTNAEQAVPATAPFLTLNRDVWERGPRLLGSVHSAYFYKGLSLIGEWNYGHAGYASPVLGTSADVPVSAFYATGAYFLTGEHVDRRAMVVPRRPFIRTRAGQRRGPGAWELVGRVSQLTLGDDVFRAGLADGQVWANSATTYELGLNWYWNEHLKLYLFWLRGHFDDPVTYALGDTRQDVDMFWVRFQLFY